MNYFFNKCTFVVQILCYFSSEKPQCVFSKQIRETMFALVVSVFPLPFEYRASARNNHTCVALAIKQHMRVKF